MRYHLSFFYQNRKVLKSCCIGKLYEVSFAERTDSIAVSRTDKFESVLDSFSEILRNCDFSSVVVAPDFFLPIKRTLISNMELHEPQNDISEVSELHEQNLVLEVRD